MSEFSTGVKTTLPEKMQDLCFAVLEEQHSGMLRHSSLCEVGLVFQSSTYSDLADTIRPNHTTPQDTQSVTVDGGMEFNMFLDCPTPCDAKFDARSAIECGDKVLDRPSANKVPDRLNLQIPAIGDLGHLATPNTTHGLQARVQTRLCRYWPSDPHDALRHQIRRTDRQRVLGKGPGSTGKVDDTLRNDVTEYTLGAGDGERVERGGSAGSAKVCELRDARLLDSAEVEPRRDESSLLSSMSGSGFMATEDEDEDEEEEDATAFERGMLVFVEREDELPIHRTPDDTNQA
ncbi:hypothetical protein BD410DRAFT_807213 [Rickenella mellea]|uniref:Uncharacterized protein n=1 Tax=Rickenella mellea TaxID=50990 RepID=A0A4Y7PQF0_9AGAM|nr:hypothetical protein BD410DRAFT_807213 [Rickenella mellea]